MSSRFVRLFASAGFALLLQIGFGGQRASATAYNFSFNGGAFGVISGVFQITGTTVTSASGNTTGSALGGNGAVSLAGSAGASGIFGRAISYTLQTVGATGPYFPNDQGPVPREFDINSGSAVFALFMNGVGGSDTITNGTGGNPLGSESLTSAAAPAPVPGAGTLSWLALALGGLWIKRRTLSGLASTLTGRFSRRASAKS